MAEVCIFTFASTHLALRAESLAEDEGLPVRMIPVPRELSADCNMGMETSLENESAAEELLEQHNVDHDSVHSKRK